MVSTFVKPVSLSCTARPHVLLLPQCQYDQPIRPIHSSAPSRNGCCVRTLRDVVARASSTEEKVETQNIENLTKDYCDDFVCTSSPAVEQTVRSLARDLQRFRYTSSLFQKDVKYQDSLRSFVGVEKLARQKWVADNMQKPIVRVSRMQMLDKGTAQIDWTAEGQLGGTTVNIPFQTVAEMNLLTGRITSLKESWDLGKVPAPANAMVAASRVAWSAKQGSQDASEGLSSLTESLSSMTSMDEDSNNFNSSDPTRFFMGGNNNNQQMNDYISLATGVALLYLAYRAFAELEKLN